ncbi:MAG: ankyrin repeat domain-containing protein [Chloroflexota bacterium]|nr:ankyrin repeat domain-containing protein [Chloroflexota bacterium]
MSEPIWDGITRTGTLTDEAAARRQYLADRAKSYDWAAVLATLSQQPDLINSTRPGGRSLYTVLHQAAHGGAPIDAVERLLAFGAWRTLRTAQGERPVDIAERGGHGHLLGRVLS